MRSDIALTLLSAATTATAQTAVSAAVFGQIQKYTAYAGAAYSENCPTPPFGSSILQTANFSTIDNQAIISYEPSSNTVVASFRGSAFPRNLDQDFLFNLSPVNIPGLSCSGCNVHTGFQNVWTTMQSSVVSSVNAALGSYPGSSLIVTGHSLGGALASLAAATFAAAGKSPTVYTFGEPRNGDANWSNYVDSLIPTSKYFRVTHYNDGVPQIPPTLLNYQHHGIEYFESRQTGNTAATTLKCIGTEPSGCNAAQNFGTSPINGAHIAYTDVLLAAVLNNPSCGYS